MTLAEVAAYTAGALILVAVVVAIVCLIGVLT